MDQIFLQLKIKWAFFYFNKKMTVFSSTKTREGKYDVFANLCSVLSVSENRKHLCLFQSP